MNVDVYAATGEKKSQLELPAELFAAPINWGLMHQALVMQQSNRRVSVAHAKRRSEVVGSTKKVYGQKHTGRARRGPIRSPLLKGGGKAFGPRKDENYSVRMPQKMRHAALRSCLSLQAGKGAILVLESYPDTVKTSAAAKLFAKMPVAIGRRVLVVAADKHRGLLLSCRNIPGVKMVYAAYLNPEDVLAARHLIFLSDALTKAQQIFGKTQRAKTQPTEERAEKAPTKKKTATAKKTSPRKKAPSA